MEQKVLGSYINSAGETWRVRGLSPLLLSRIRKAVETEWVANNGNIPAIPTYTIKTVTGEDEVHTHDPSTLVIEGNPEQTEINQKAWFEYTRVQLEIDKAFNVKLMRAVFSAVQCQPDETWRDEMKSLRLDIPSDKMDEKMMFIETRVIQSPNDIASLMSCVLRTAGVIPEEAVAEAQATFRGALEKATAELASAKDKENGMAE